MDIRLIQNGDAQRLSEYHRENRVHFRPWEPLTPRGYHSVENWQSRVRVRLAEQRDGKAAYFVALEADKVVAHCTLSNICYGAFMACYMGYGVAGEFEGRGIMRQTCLRAVDHAFNDLGLNRIMANYMPHNNRSAKLLKGLGFVIEGKADNYLKINGKWENHILTSLTNPSRR